ncbi:hypothetical protein DRQ25_05285 [Candidatus Fermentibacteria bacterium]|nr:MAG: hypothetical protein DRQ25_05285 [Candidatus Fermentibacteria bacterium]
MTDRSDVRERIERWRKEEPGEEVDDYISLLCDAAERIEELEKALLPLANVVDICQATLPGDYVAWGLNSNDITVGDIRRACILLGVEIPVRHHG